jgi:multiple sugar transport system permease protein
MKPRKVRGLLLLAILLAGVVLTLAPLGWMLSASFMTAGEANSVPPPLLPRRFSLDQYVTLFTRLNLARQLLSSIFISVTATVVSVLLNAMAGYAFAKLRFRARERLFGILMVGLLIPGQVGMLPLFLLLKQMGLVNTYVGVMIPYLASIFGIFLVRQYLASIPDELLDAARVDGAGEIRIFRSIVVPIIRPILVTLAAFSLLGAWNDFMWPLIILSDEAKYTLPVALANLSGEHVQDTELMMAGSVLTVVPVLLAFLLLQRAYIRGILAGGIKG